jgi:simple sugar transport system substrate-binding protein
MQEETMTANLSLKGRGAGWVGAAALALVLAGPTLVGNDMARAEDEAPIRIAFVSGPLYDSFFPPLYQGANDAAALLGVDLNYIPIDEHDIEASSARTMQVAIAQAPDAIVVGSFISTVVDPYIVKAVEAGIPVYVNQSGQATWEQVGAFGFVGQVGPDAGVVAAKHLHDAGSSHVLCVINVPGNPYLQAICKGLNEEITKLGGTSDNLELPTADSTDQAKVSRNIGAYLQTHKEIDSIFTLNAAVATAATAAIDAAQLTGKIRVGTLEISKVALEQIQNGKIEFLINEQPYLDGFYGVLFAYHYVKYGLAPVGMVHTGPSVVDKKNVEKIVAVFNKYPNVVGSQ